MAKREKGARISWSPTCRMRQLERERATWQLVRRRGTRQLTLKRGRGARASGGEGVGSMRAALVHVPPSSTAQREIQSPGGYTQVSDMYGQEPCEDEV